MKNLIPFAVFLVFFSCQKAQRDEDTATNTAEDISIAQVIYADAYKIMREVALNTAGISSSSTSITTLFGCESIKVDTLTDPKKITIDFKYIGCQGLNQDRYGRLIGEFFGEFPLENSAMDLTFSNYYYGDYEVNGKIRVILKGMNDAGNDYHSFYVQGGSIESDDGTITWTASQTWEVLGISGDVSSFSISGTSNGVNQKGNVFFSEIKSAIQVNDKCVNLLSGKHEVEVLNLSNRTVSYESNSCVNQGIVTVNGTRIPFAY